MGGQHLTWENRIAIESLLKAKVSASKIAAVVGCSKRTVYREIQRGQCEQLNGTTYEMYTIYSAQKAQNRADQMNDLHKGRPVKLCPELAAAKPGSAPPDAMKYTGSGCALTSSISAHTTFSPSALLRLPKNSAP